MIQRRISPSTVAACCCQHPAGQKRTCVTKGVLQPSTVHSRARWAGPSSSTVPSWSGAKAKNGTTIAAARILLPGSLANLGAVRLVCCSAKCAAGMVASDCQCIGVVQQRWSRPTTACHCHRLQEIERSKLPAVLGVIAVIGPLPSGAMLLMKDDLGISFLRTF